MAPGFRCGAISARRAPQAPTGAQRMTRSAPRSGLGRRSPLDVIGKAELAHALAARRGDASAMRRSSRARVKSRAARAIDEPIRPMPISASRSKIGCTAIRGGFRSPA